MPFGRNSHGGRRANSGRRHTSETLGAPDRQGGLHRFFSAPFFVGRQTQDTTEDAEHIAANALVPVANQDTNLQEPTPETLPNYDAHDDGFDEQLSQKGKHRKLFTESSNLGVQRKMIMDKVSYDTAYKNISQYGICWHNPPTYIKKTKFPFQIAMNL